MGARAAKTHLKKKKKTTKEKKYGGEKCAKSPDMRGTLELCVCVCVCVHMHENKRETQRETKS